MANHDHTVTNGVIGTGSGFFGILASFSADIEITLRIALLVLSTVVTSITLYNLVKKKTKVEPVKE